jgi:hypothetical protein
MHSVDPNINENDLLLLVQAIFFYLILLKAVLVLIGLIAIHKFT